MKLESHLKTIGVFVVVACVSCLGWMSPGLVLAGQDKIPICHREGNGTYHRIDIAEPAYLTHIAHGDKDIGDLVPRMPGYVFDEDCIPVKVECPCHIDLATLQSYLPNGLVAEYCNVTSDYIQVFATDTNQTRVIDIGVARDLQICGAAYLYPAQWIELQENLTPEEISACETDTLTLIDDIKDLGFLCPPGP